MSVGSFRHVDIDNQAAMGDTLFSFCQTWIKYITVH